MIRIEKVLIENFQSHENTELAFHDGLNVIVGPSDHGKSAVIRAIRWVLYNEPRGSDFVRQGTNFARVTLWLSTGFVITRERTPSKNRYILSDEKGNTNIYEGFGNEVPQEIINAHGIPKVVLDTDINSSINIGSQLEGPFLISESGAVRAKAIGRLTGLHIIDKAIRDSATDLRRENQTKDRIGKELDEVDEKLKEYQYLDELEEKIELSSKLIENIEKHIKKLSLLTDIKYSLEDVNEKYKETLYVLSKLEKIDEFEKIIKCIDADFIRLKTLDNLKNRYNSNLMAAKEMERIFSMTKGVNGCISLIEEAEERTVRYEKLQKAGNNLRVLEKERIAVENVLKNTEKIGESDIIINQIREKVIKMSKLVSIKEKLVNYDSEIAKVDSILKRSIDLNASDVVITSIDRKSELLARLENIKNRLMPILDKIREGNNYLNNNKQEIEKYLNMYTELLKESGKCPLCNSKISDDKLGEIIKHYKEAH
ncbi:AAA family ATPase [Acetivibrio clariflavus]|uniref:Nuclease SbcCD subunit C n=1 Tax=Acetivibrio clariflavus (strain DSM 19732 / NBRC 101661 / EBR45) TaxID=720554 RepID=G8LZ19_ACECE|nr:AAA family ATPase [Acetivibrio clariflavus]AEV68963.1 Rad50 zinc hook motif protein [Acetivibrio clariflavus DSM 19732]